MPKFCKDCGADVVGKTFCGECGVAVAEVKPAAVAEVKPVEVKPVAVVEVKPVPVVEVKPVAVVVKSVPAKPAPKATTSTPMICSDCGDTLMKGFQDKRCARCGTAADANLNKKAIQDTSENKKDFYKASGYGGAPDGPTSTLPKEVDMTGADLKAALKKVTDRKNDTNWCLFQLADGGKSEKMEALSTGEGGYGELSTVLSESNNKILFGCFLVIGWDRDEGGSHMGTTRLDKLVYFSFVGSGIPELLKAQANALKRKVEKFFGSLQLTLDILGSQLDLLTPNQIGFQLMNASSAHKPSHLDFGGKIGEIETKAFTNEDASDDEESDSDFD